MVVVVVEVEVGVGVGVEVEVEVGVEVVVEVVVEVEVGVEVVVEVEVEVGVGVGVGVVLVLKRRDRHMAKSTANKTAATASTNGKAIGLNSFIGQRVTLFCANYFYTGTLVDVLDDCVHLTEPSIVYETGAWSNKAWSDAQALPGAIFVMRASIESFGAMK